MQFPCSLRSIALIGLGLGLTGQAFSQTFIGYDPNAPESNFGAPGTTSDQVAYTISLSEDATNLYGTIAADPAAGGTYSSGLLFSNLYFGTGSTATNGSTLGIEITNDQAFSPGNSGYFSLAGTGFSYTENAATGVITFTLPWSFLETDPLGVGFSPVSAANPEVLLRLSQSFGYSVAGGIANFGSNDLGVETLPVPEPSTWALALLGCAGFTFAVRRQRRLARMRNVDVHAQAI